MKTVMVGARGVSDVNKVRRSRSEVATDASSRAKVNRLVVWSGLLADFRCEVHMMDTQGRLVRSRYHV